MAEAASHTNRRGTSSRWLIGPGVDLLAGCGLGYLAVFAVLAAAGPPIRQIIPLSLLPLLALTFSAPHYGATLLRVYQDPDDRRRYASVTTGATLLVAAAFLVSLKLHALGTLLVTIYLIWSPWHYSGQNFGISLMFLGRRGVETDSRMRTALHASFVIPFLIFTVQTNGEAPNALFASNIATQGSDAALRLYQQVPLGIPAAIQGAAIVALLVAYVLALLSFATLALRKNPLRDVAPAFAIITTQSFWFALPACVRLWDLAPGILPLDSRTSLYAFQWVATGHAVQYLWITIYYNRKSGARPGSWSFYGKSLLAGQVLWTLPMFAFAPAITGAYEYSGDLAILVAAAINIHHFILDGAIWKLRDGRLSRVLIGGASATREAPRSRPTSWVRRTIWAACTILVFSEAVVIIERHALDTAAAFKDLDRAERAVGRLEILGRGDYRHQHRLGILAVEVDEPEKALYAFARSVALQETPGSYYEMARIRVARGEWNEASDAFEGAYAMAPFTSDMTLAMAKTLVRAGRIGRAREILQEARAADPANEKLEAELRQLDSRFPARQGSGNDSLPEAPPV